MCPESNIFSILFQCLFVVMLMGSREQQVDDASTECEPTDESLQGDETATDFTEP
jgi:hypothetical protein